MADNQSSGSSVQDLERENARLRRELAAARGKRLLDRDTIWMLLSSGKVLGIEDVRKMIAAGGPYLPYLLEFEREMLEEERELEEMMAHPVPLDSVFEDLERLIGADDAK